MQNARVTFIRPARSKGYVRVGADDSGEMLDLTVSEAEYSAAGSPLASDILTRDAISLLKDADMRYRARLKAMRILSFGDNSERILCMKLVRAGFSREVSEQTVREMVSLGYLNNSRQLERLILNEANIKMSGPMRIIPRLMAKGYSRGEINDMISVLTDTGEIDFDAVKKRLISTKLDGCTDSTEIGKLLYKHGFGLD